jgi:hypothetical protein
MRIAVLGICLIAASLIAAAGFGAGEGTAQTPSPVQIMQAAARGELIALDAMVGDKIQQVTIIDPKRRSLSVYHIELETGKIHLRSVRNISGDLEIEEYNTARPLPHEIRRQLEQK